MMHGSESLSSSKRGDDSPAFESLSSGAGFFCINGVLDPFPCLRYRLRMPDADDKLTPVNLLHHGASPFDCKSVESPSEIPERRYRPRTFRPDRGRSLRLPFSRRPLRLEWSVPRQRGHALSPEGSRIVPQPLKVTGRLIGGIVVSVIMWMVSIGGNRNTILPSDEQCP